MDQKYEFEIEGDDPTSTIIISFAGFIVSITAAAIVAMWSMFLDEHQTVALARRATIVAARADLMRFKLQRLEWKDTMRNLAPSDTVLIKRADALATDIDAADRAWTASPRQLGTNVDESIGFVGTLRYILWMAPASKVVTPAERKALARLVRVYEQLMNEMRTVKTEMDIRLNEQDRQTKNELLLSMYNVLQQSEGGSKAFAAFGNALSDDEPLTRARHASQRGKPVADD